MVRTTRALLFAVLAFTAACGDGLVAPTASRPSPDAPPLEAPQLAPAAPPACADCVFGPKAYLKSATEYRASFDADPTNSYQLIAATSTGARARIKLNGVVWTLGKEGATDALQVAVVLRALRNELAVLVSGAAGGQVTISIVGKPRGWRLLAPKGSGPTGMSASVAAPELNAVFAAQMYDYVAGTLWRFNLATDTWTQLQADNWPLGKYRKLIYDPAKHRLYTYWDGQGQVYSIPETGGSWVPEGSAGNSDEYYEGYGFLNPVTGRLVMFAGYGFGTWKDLWWEWDAGSNQWTSVATGSPRPEPRFGYGAVVDVAGKRAFLGQRSLGAAPGNYDDLWAVDLTTYAWTSLIAPNTGPDARILSGMTYDGGTHTLYRYGGYTLYGFTPTGDFLSAKPDGVAVAWSPVSVAGTTPGARVGPGLFTDAPRNRLILVSGGNGATSLDDVWAFYLP